MFTILTVKNRDLKLRLRARDIIAVEQKLNQSLIEIFAEMSTGANDESIKLIPLSKIAIILHNSLQSLEHGFTVEKTLDLIDDILQEKGYMSLMTILLELLEKSGLLKADEEDIEKAKQKVEEGNKSEEGNIVDLMK